MIKLMAAIAAVLLIASTVASEARTRHHHSHHTRHYARVATGEAAGVFYDNSGRVTYVDAVDAVEAVSRHSRGDSYTYDDGKIVGHPAGCPGTAFCGCGVSVKVFGHPVRNLYLAANWLKYPPAAPGPGMVAARHGHVMYIEAIDANGNAVVYDPNSGGHQTRVHTRSLAGYRVVNPHGA